MTLQQLCEEISCNDPNVLPEASPIGSRIMCPEYSLHVKDIKTYPLSKDERLFALCWVIGSNNSLYGTIKPAKFSYSYRCKFKEGTRTQMHTHEYLELAYIVSGTFRQRILDKDIVFKQGELCLIDKNCLHQDYLNNGPACILFIGIANDMFDNIISDQVADERIISFLQTASQKQKSLWQYLHFKPKNNLCEEMEENLKKLLQELIKYDKASNYICHGYLMRIFRLLSTDYDISVSVETQKRMNWLLFDEITSYIKCNFREISLKKLSDHFHFSEDYFNRLIKTRTGLTYTEFVQSLRLKEAEKLLLHSALNIDDIAAKVGYQNKGYFYKIFIKKHNMTPAEYRKETINLG